MALVTDIQCKICKKTKHEVTDHSGVCAECRRIAADEARAMHLGGLAALPLEKRIARIEAALYDLDAENRLKVLENASAKY